MQFAKLHIFIEDVYHYDILETAILGNPIEDGACRFLLACFKFHVILISKCHFVSVTLGECSIIEPEVLVHGEQSVIYFLCQ